MPAAGADGRTPDAAVHLDTAAVWCVGLIALAFAAWLAALVLMAGMDQGPGTPLHDFPTFLIGWIIMLAAMMLPSELNYVRVYAGLLAGRGIPGRRSVVAISAFIGGYAIAWTAYGAFAFLLDAAIREGAGDLILRLGLGPPLAGAVLVIAAAYQLSPMKRACLTHCRTPLSHFARHWRPGSAGALRMGFGHGLLCVGCCWALMAVMFAVGAMSLIWMGLLALLMFAEKMLPGGGRLAMPIALFLGVMGLWIALSPATAPLMADPLLFGSSICRVF